MLIQVFKNSLMITSFVLVMMLIIEFINVQTRGNWSKHLKKSGILQIIVAALLGIIPGCLGAYTAVSLYTHNIFSFAAIVTAMIATFGDEAFIMITIMPGVTLKLVILTFIISVATGSIIYFFFKNRRVFRFSENNLVLHDEYINCICIDRKLIFKQLKQITFHRAILIFGLFLFIFGLITGQFAHDHNLGNFHIDDGHGHSHDHSHSSGWDWVRITFLFVSVAALLIISTVNDHFLQEHLWGHIIKVHFLRVFLWTIAALIFIYYLEGYLHIEEWIESNHLTILIIAVLIGIIPESGPHYIFIFMFIEGTIPFSILLANSIVQDGHGALPLLAESRKSFITMKLINIAVGLIFGLAGFYLNF